MISLKLNQMDNCKCPKFRIFKDEWLFGEHFCENGEWIPPWTKMESKPDQERKICERINNMMEQDGFDAPKLEVSYLEAFQKIHDYIVSIRKDIENGDGSV